MSDHIPPPDGYEIVTEGCTKMGDMLWFRDFGWQPLHAHGGPVRLHTSVARPITEHKASIYYKCPECAWNALVPCPEHKASDPAAGASVHIATIHFDPETGEVLDQPKEAAGATIKPDLTVEAGALLPTQLDDLCDFVAKDGTRCTERAGCGSYPAYSLHFCSHHSSQAWGNGRLLNRSRDAKARRFKAAGRRLQNDWQTRAADPEKERLNTVLRSVSCGSVEELRDRYLRQMHENTQRHLPAGFDSWETYHAHVEKLKAGAAEARAQMQNLRGELAAEERDRDAEKERADKLQAFKDYVHKRLDDAGVPADPESSHKAEGCRIGGRLDIALAEKQRADRAEERLNDCGAAFARIRELCGATDADGQAAETYVARMKDERDDLRRQLEETKVELNAALQSAREERIEGGKAQSTVASLRAALEGMIARTNEAEAQEQKEGRSAAAGFHCITADIGRKALRTQEGGAE